ncbi:hypothetical protein A1O7_06093 [Cladophialophora yegresii CBS 114405]|uniref:Oxidoreductase FAD/NAD(P)-binding domain-containing protein n=1 Tax=Cladophialophora yegresii CBS 114405 TaxID=1182544 RepID=W9W113_9EURO|nr:uncharacterized protein A1O7_06093 [Cladophialophora yegresii CBS 114405]EXJ58665.1 hypothetical protein A1O7_06093 [Cladophialophora yegresii CBS 114405]
MSSNETSRLWSIDQVVIPISKPDKYSLSDNGDFFLIVREERDDHARIVLLSAGVALTPLTSILNTSIAKRGHEVSWVHVNKSQQSHAFYDHVKDMPDLSPWTNKPIFHSSVHYDHKGRSDLSKLDPEKDLKLNDKNATCYICGRGQFMVELEHCPGEERSGCKHDHMEVFGTGGVLQMTGS